MPASPPARDPVERRLMRQLASRDPGAAETIQAEYGGVLRGYLRQLLGDDGAADDVLQRVLLESWQRGPSFDRARGSVMTWLMTIARSRAIDALRRRVPEPFDPETATAILDSTSTAEDHAEAVASQWQLAHLLSRLSREHAELLRMRFQLSMSQSEIAAATGIPLGTVKRRMVSGLERLRELTEQER